MSTQRRMASWAAIVMILFAACKIPTSHADTGSQVRQYDAWRLADIRNISPEVSARLLATYPEYDRGEDADPRIDGSFQFFTLSPDGGTIVFQASMENQTNGDNDRMFCRYGLDDDTLQCTTLLVREAAFNPLLEQINWSADGTKIAMTEDPFTRMQESDIWVLDVETLVFLNMTNDGIAGNFLNEDRTAYQIDFTPLWSPATGDLYFFRSVWRNEVWTEELWRLPKDSKEPEQVLDLGFEMPQFLVQNQAYAAFSPDGQTIAIAPTTNKPPITPGIWLIDLTAKQVTPFVTIEDLQAGWPAWAEEERLQRMDGVAQWIQQILWSPDGQNMIVKVFNPQYATKIQTNNFLAVNVQDKTVTALADYNPFGSEPALNKEVFDGPGFPVPGVGIIAPDGGSLFFISALIMQQEEKPVYAVPLPFGSEPVSIESIQDEDLAAAILIGPSASRYIDLHLAAPNGRVLIESALLTFE